MTNVGATFRRPVLTTGSITQNCHENAQKNQNPEASKPQRLEQKATEATKKRAVHFDPPTNGAPVETHRWVWKRGNSRHKEGNNSALCWLLSLVSIMILLFFMVAAAI
jgi:hypothetical protein